MSFARRTPQDRLPAPRRSRLAVPPAQRQRSARMILETNGAHRLVLEIGPAALTVDRDQARRAMAALEPTTNESVRTIAVVFAPWVTPDDVGFVRSALREFLDEVAVEDRRPDGRTYRATKAVVV